MKNMQFRFLFSDIITYDREKVAEKWWNDADEMTQDDYGKEHFKMPMRSE